MLSVICDTHFDIIIGHNSQVEEYELEFLGDNLTTMEGLFAPIATVTNFLIQFLDSNIILGYMVITFRRLYNFFTHYRKHLEGSILIILDKVILAHQKNVESGRDPRFSDSRVVVQLIQSTQKWFNFLVDSKYTDKSFVKKLTTKPNLAFLNTQESRSTRDLENVNRKHHLKVLNFIDIEPISGHHRFADIYAG